MNTEDNDTGIDIAQALGAQASRIERFAILIPNKDCDGHPVDQQTWVDKAMRLLIDINRGASAMPAMRGGWKNDAGEVIMEEPIVVYSYVKPDTFSARLSEIKQFVEDMARELRQEAVAMEFGDEFLLSFHDPRSPR